MATKWPDQPKQTKQHGWNGSFISSSYERATSVWSRRYVELVSDSSITPWPARHWHEWNNTGTSTEQER